MPRSGVFARVALVSGGLLFGVALVGTITLVGGGRDRPQYEVLGPVGGPGYFRPDPDLGYAPAPAARVRSIRRHDGRVVYDVRYSIDEYGLRVTPGSGEHGRAIVFFGGSFTFGEGVEDDQTLPARLAAWLNDGTPIVNAGFHGYGPHQMLRALETGRLDHVLADGVEQVVYQGIGGHVARVAGRTTWDVAGPAYESYGDSVRYVGPFHAPLPALGLRVLGRLAPTRDIVQWWLDAGNGETAADLDRFVEVVVRSAAIVRERWGARFTVLWWDEVDDPIVGRLEARGLDVLRVSDILGRRRRRRFRLPADGHPNARAYGRLAHALARHVLKARRASMSPPARARRSPPP